MLTDSVDYSLYSAPVFTGRGLPIDLNYVMAQRIHLLPERVVNRVKEITALNPAKMPSLKEVHTDVYAPLLKCETLDKAKELFPEFKNLIEATVPFQRCTGNIKKLKEGGYLKEGLTLKLLQDIWANLKTEDEIAKAIGLEGRGSLGWVLHKIGFTSLNPNYRTLIMSSDPAAREVIASKTRAWNALHPDLMRARNIHAAQGTKTPEYRKIHAQMMRDLFEKQPERRQRVSESSKKFWSNPLNRLEHSKNAKEYAKLHPEKAEKSRELSKLAWEQIPEIRKLMSGFFDEYTKGNEVTASRLRNIFDAKSQGRELTQSEQKLIGAYNKAFFTKYPEAKAALREAYKKAKEIKAGRIY